MHQVHMISLTLCSPMVCACVMHTEAQPIKLKWPRALFRSHCSIIVIFVQSQWTAIGNETPKWNIFLGRCAILRFVICQRSRNLPIFNLISSEIIHANKDVLNLFSYHLVYSSMHSPIEHSLCEKKINNVDRYGWTKVRNINFFFLLRMIKFWIAVQSTLWICFVCMVFFFISNLRSKYEKRLNEKKRKKTHHKHTCTAVHTCSECNKKPKRQNQRQQIINHPICNSINIIPVWQRNHSLGMIEFIGYI